MKKQEMMKRIRANQRKEKIRHNKADLKSAGFKSVIVKMADDELGFLNGNPVYVQGNYIMPYMPTWITLADIQEAKNGELTARACHF